MILRVASDLIRNNYTANPSKQLEEDLLHIYVDAMTSSHPSILGSNLFPIALLKSWRPLIANLTIPESLQTIDAVSRPVLTIYGSKDISWPHEEESDALTAMLKNSQFSIVHLPLDHDLLIPLVGDSSDSDARIERLDSAPFDAIQQWLLKN